MSSTGKGRSTVTKKRPTVFANIASKKKKKKKKDRIVDNDHPDGSRIVTSYRNVVELVGRLATAPDIRTFASGTSLARLLVTVRTHKDRPRTDVMPVTVWDPDGSVQGAERGDGVTIGGTVQRRFWTDYTGRRSRIEVVVSSVEVTTEEASH